MRGVFVEGNDAVLYKMVLNYTIACNEVFWREAKPDSFILKTIGVQATFDILRKLAYEAYEKKNVGVTYFKEKIQQAGMIDFSHAQFKNPSGSGRTYIRKTIEEAIGLKY